jgi:hypothetical protein
MNFESLNFGVGIARKGTRFVEKGRGNKLRQGVREGEKGRERESRTAAAIAISKGTA